MTKSLLPLFLFFLSFPVYSGEKKELSIIIINGTNTKRIKNFPLFSLEKEYMIKEHRYWQDEKTVYALFRKGNRWEYEEWKRKNGKIYRPLAASVIDELKSAKLLYIGQYAGNCHTVFNFPGFSEAVKGLLKNGGTIFFDFLSASLSYTEFLKSIGVKNPAPSFKSGYYDAFVPQTYRKMKLFTTPNNIVDGRFKAFGWWESCAQNQKAPLRYFSNQDNKLSMIIQENVLGAGRVIFNQCPGIFRKKSLITENLLSYIFGVNLKNIRKQKIIESGGPGDLVALEPLSAKDRPLESNPLYFIGMADKAWSIKEADFRIPVLVTEPSGIERLNAPVSVMRKFPPSISPSSVRVCTAYGDIIPSQVNVIDKKTNLFEIIFELDMPANWRMPLFIYYGGRQSAPKNAKSDLYMEESKDFFTLANNRLKVLFLKKASSRGAAFVTLKIVGRRDSQLTGIADCFIPSGHAGVLAPGTRGRITDKGPIRISIKYGEGDDAVVYSLYSNSNLLYYRGRGGKNVHRIIKWTPGGDVKNDFAYYESEKGVKRFNVSYNVPGDLKTIKLTRFIKEGWLAYCDEKKDVAIGECFSKADCKYLYVYNHFTGYSTKLNSSMAGALFVAPEADFRLVRKAYCQWVSPLLVSFGASSKKHDIPQKVPVWGKDFWRIHLLTGRVGKPNEIDVEKAVDFVREFGANTFHVWFRPGMGMTPKEEKDYDNFTPEIVKAAHRKGMAVVAFVEKPARTPGELHEASWWASPDGKKRVNRLSPILGEALYVREARIKAKSGADAIWMLDEYIYDPPYLSGKAKKIFKEKYGIEPPEILDMSKINDPEQYYRLIFKSDVHLDIMKKLCEEVRKINPDIVIISTTSPVNVSFVKTYHDLEKVTEYITTAALDLYTTDLDTLKFFIKYGRGSMGNNKPFLSFAGMPELGREGGLLNCLLHLFCGSNSMNYFNLTQRYSDRDAGIPVKEVYEFLDFTKLGSYLVRCFPMRFIAILRDRDNFFGELKRGNRTSQMSVTDQRVRDLLNSLGNYPVDIVFSKQFDKPGAMQGYKVLFLPEDPDISEKTAKRVKEFVAKGGTAIIEGAAIKNPLIAEICGLEDLNNVAKREIAFKGKMPFISGIDFNLMTSFRQVKNKSAEILATDSKGAPLFTVSNFGKGKAVYTSLVLSSCASLHDEIGIVLRKLVEKYDGPPPVTANADNVYFNVLKNKNDTIIAIYNKAGAREFDINLNMPLEKDGILMSFQKGRFIPVKDGKASIDMNKNEVDFILITRKSDFKIPTVTPAKCASINESPKPENRKYGRLTFRSGNRKKTKKKKIPGKIYVGVFDIPEAKGKLENTGKNSIMESLEQFPEVIPSFIEEMTLGELEYFDVVIVPNLTYSGRGKPKGWEKNLREYVENGGGVLLVHHSVGYVPASRAARLFPEIGEGVDYAPITSFNLIGKHPVVTAAAFLKKFPNKVKDPAFAMEYTKTVMKQGDIVKSNFPDYIILKKGKRGIIIARSAQEGERGNTPAIIAGKIGKGRVVLCGMSIGVKAWKEGKKWKKKETLSSGEKSILLNSVYWLAERNGK